VLTALQVKDRNN